MSSFCEGGKISVFCYSSSLNFHKISPIRRHLSIKNLIWWKELGSQLHINHFFNNELNSFWHNIVGLLLNSEIYNAHNLPKNACLAEILI